MASDYSFDVTCEYDGQEMLNAVDQAKREISNRFDFKGVLADIDYSEKEHSLTIHTDSDYKLQAIIDILESKMVKRDLNLKILDKSSPVEMATGSTVRQKITLRSGLHQDDAKKLAKLIRDKYPKAKAMIQGEEIRVTSKSKDELQGVMQVLKSSELELPLQFGNFR